jgi:hypothetical protein
MASLARHAGLVLIPMGFSLGWWVRSSEHDTLVNELFIEAKARERLGETIPVAIRPERRKRLEAERDDIVMQLTRLQERRDARAYSAAAHELRVRMWDEGRLPASVEEGAAAPAPPAPPAPRTPRV